MEKKCLWLEFEEMKREVEELKVEKKKCREDMDVRISYNQDLPVIALKLHLRGTTWNNLSMQQNAKEESVVPIEDLLEKESIKLEKAKAEYVCISFLYQRMWQCKS